MKIWGDYHTHTTFSHGKGTVLENALAAKKLGLKQIAITDHGFGHILYGMDRAKMANLKQEILEAEKQTGIKIFLGVEANFVGKGGKIDLTQDDFKLFDIVLVGQHRFVKSGFMDKLRFLLPNMLCLKTKKLRALNTQILIQAMENHPIDVVTHLKHHMPINLEAVAKKAVQTSTLIELNASKMLFTKEEINLMVNLGVNFIINSDAHKPENVGDVQNVLDMLKEYNVPENQVANLNKLPIFKSEKKL